MSSPTFSNSIGGDETYSSTSDDSTADFPSIARRASWNAIDAATARRKANMQGDIAAQELRALKRCHELRIRICCKATAGLTEPEPLIIPEPWMVSQACTKRLVEHPFLFESYLEVEQSILNLIRMRKRFLQLHIRHSSQFLILSQFRQEMERLDSLEKQRKDLLASRLLVDLILEAFRHVTATLLVDMTERDEEQKTPAIDICHRLLVYSAYPDNGNELIIAAQDIEDMEREHLPWRYTDPDCLSEGSATSSMCKYSPVLARSSPLADEIQLSPEPTFSPSSIKDTPLKGPTRLRVRLQDCLTTRTPES
ncbi:hypothetical protein G6011_00306 [Alternaria panax]|uniref:Uncharacterized protein n=1 Tax=Alternaria panax TaxID=48097 RepID=A0AAD4NTG7_9PLEO|nr:hypothetical protein G6011_00306 [Alternaria panax]